MESQIITALLESTTNFVVQITSELKVIRMNTLVSRFHGCDVAKVIGDSYLNCLAQDDWRDYLQQALPDLLSKQTTISKRINTRNHQGQSCAIEWRCTALREKDSTKNTGYLLLGLLTTTPQYCLDKLSPEFAEITADELLAVVPGSVYWKDKKGVYQGANDQAARMLNLNSRYDVVGLTDQDIVALLKTMDNKLAESFQTIDKQVLDSGLPMLDVLEQPFATYEGEEVVQVSNKYPLYSKQGELIGLIGTSINIRNRIQLEQTINEHKELAEKKAEAAQQNLENIIMHMPGSVYWRDRNGVYRGCNQHALDIFGFTNKEQLVGKTLEEISKNMGWDPLLIDSFNTVDRGIIETGIPILNNEEDPFQMANGKIIHQLTNKVPLKDENGNVRGVIGIAIDISDRKRIEQALLEAKEQAELSVQAKTEFIANMSHDLRTPLGAILGLTGVMIRYIDSPKLPELITKLNISAARVDTLIQEILDFSELDAHKVKIKVQPVNLKTLLHENTVVIEHLTRPKQVDVLLDYSSACPETISMDEKLLNRIVTNLLGNAAKFTDSGHIKLIVFCDSEQLTLAVEDTGIGIPENKLDYIFDSFARIGLSDSSRYKGTGLGLAITKKLVDVLGGRIWVESTLGQGSKFTCSFPRATLLSDAATKLNHKEKITG